MFIYQLQSKVMLSCQLYQSFHEFQREHEKEDTAKRREIIASILQVRRDMVNNIKEHRYSQIDLKQDLNQHLLRLAMPQYDVNRKDNVELLLSENVFLTLKINKINWNSLLVHEDADMYYEVTLQIFFNNGRPLSQKTMIPLLSNRDESFKRRSISWIFQQIPMQALIMNDLALVVEVFKVQLKFGDSEPLRCFNVTKNCSQVKTFEGWSTINLSATYIMSNLMAGQNYEFNMLRFFEAGRDKRHSIAKRYMELEPEHVRSKVSSAVLSQVLGIGGTFSFDTDLKKSKSRVKSGQTLMVDLHRMFERGIYTTNSDMQKLFTEKLSGTFDYMQLTVNSFKIANPPLNSLIKVEVALVDSSSKLLEDVWSSTPDMLDSQVKTIFESETRELTGSRSDLKDTTYLKLPQVANGR